MLYKKYDLLNMMKGIDKKPTTNIMLSDERFSFPLKVGNRQGCLLLPLISNIVLEVVAR